MKSATLLALVLVSASVLLIAGVFTGLIPSGNGLTTVVLDSQGNPVVTTSQVVSGGDALPVEILKAQAKNKFTMSAIGTANYYIEFFSPGSNVADPNINYLDYIDVDGGSGNTTNYVIQTNTPYDVYFSGVSTYYDSKLSPFLINYNKDTGVGFLLVDGLSYVEATPFGAFVDVNTLPEVQTGWDQSGNETDSNSFTALDSAVTFGDSDADECLETVLYNGSTVITGNFSVSGCTATLTGTAAYNNTAVTANYTKVLYDVIRYDESAMGGSGWFKIDLGNANSNSVVKDAVLCFNDADGDMENNEVTAISAAYVSGSTKIQVSADLLSLWQDAMGGGPECVVIATELGSSEKARWEFTFTVDESNWDTTEEFELIIDDLGAYLGKEYPSRDSKATAETLTVGNQA